MGMFKLLPGGPRLTGPPLVLVATVALLLGSCGSDGTSSTDTEVAATEAAVTTESIKTTDAVTTTESIETTDAATTTEPRETTEPVVAFTVNVTARDFAFEGMPDTVPVGTKISLTSAAGGEAHEMAIFKTDNPGEIRGMQHSYWVQAYAGSTDDPGLRLSPETLTEPGHYWYICTLPFGTTNEVFESKRVFENVEPSAAHYSQGMIGEFDVVADS